MTRLVWLRGAEELFYVAFLGLCAEYGCEHSPHCEVARRHNGGRENEPLPRQARLSTGLLLRTDEPPRRCSMGFARPLWSGEPPLCLGLRLGP